MLIYFIGCDVDFCYMLGRYTDALDAYKAASMQSDKGLHPLPFAWNRCLLLQKPQLHLYSSQIIDPKPKGRQPLLAFALLFAAIVLSVRKSRYNLSDISIISPFWLALEAWGESAGILKNSFGLLLTASWRDIKRNLHWFFFFLFWLLLNFCTESRQGVLPVGAVSIVPLKMERVKTDCFSGSGGEEQAQKVYSNFSLTLPWDVFRASLLCLSGVWSVFDKGLASVCLLTQT